MWARTNGNLYLGTLFGFSEVYLIFRILTVDPSFGGIGY